VVTELFDDDAFCEAPPPPGSAALPDAADDEIDVRTLARMLSARDAGEDDFLLVDVREPLEREIVAIPGDVAVPLADLEADPLAVGTHGRRLVLYCRSGARSARALAALRAAGRADAVHVAGGVLAWVREVEPGKPVY
jgi:rhodanese-related sulfurtransferase